MTSTEDQDLINQGVQKPEVRKYNKALLVGSVGLAVGLGGSSVQEATTPSLEAEKTNEDIEAVFEELVNVPPYDVRIVRNHVTNLVRISHRANWPDNLHELIVEATNLHREGTQNNIKYNADSSVNFVDVKNSSTGEKIALKDVDNPSEYFSEGAIDLGGTRFSALLKYKSVESDDKEIFLYRQRNVNFQTISADNLRSMDKNSADIIEYIPEGSSDAIQTVVHRKSMQGEEYIFTVWSGEGNSRSNQQSIIELDSEGNEINRRGDLKDHYDPKSMYEGIVDEFYP